MADGTRLEGSVPPEAQSADAARGSAPAVIRVEGLYKVFYPDTGPLMALRDVTLDIAPGEFITVVGPSGCGKSTLLNVIAGLLQPTHGQVLLEGKPVREPSRHIGVMFQSPVLFAWRTVLENVLLPIEIFGLKKDEYRQRAVDLLVDVGLEGWADSYPSQLSGGMQQRASLSRVLLYDPDVLLLDEPFGALDEFTREAMNLELLALWSRTRKTIALVTHNINEAVFLSDRVVVMTPRPGEVARVISIDLPRPRKREVMKTPRYAELVFEIRELLGVA